MNGRTKAILQTNEQKIRHKGGDRMTNLNDFSRIGVFPAVAIALFGLEGKEAEKFFENYLKFRMLTEIIIKYRFWL